MATELLSADHCKAWEKHGKLFFLKTWKSILSSQSNDTERDVSELLYVLCWHVIHGNLNTDLALSTLADIFEQSKHMVSIFTDVLSVIDLEILSSLNKSHHDRFTYLIGNLQNTHIPDALLRERLDLETLEAAGLVTSKLLFQQKLVKIKTRLYYKQNKFNLLREESEGYSKLITELNQTLTPDMISQLIENIKSLIGVFYLDPNRVLDIIIEAFELRPHLDAIFVPILRSYAVEASTICHILGFKFQFYEIATAEQTPTSLYKVTALLLKHGLVQLDDIYPHLAPTDHNMSEHHKNALTEAKSYERKMTVVVLTDKPEEPEAEVESKDDVVETNQKLGLIVGLLEVGDWLHAKNVMDRLPPFFAAAYEPVATMFGSLIHSAIEPLYQQYTTLPDCLLRHRKRPDPLSSGLEPARTYADLTNLVFPMLSYLGPHIHYDIQLLVKLIRLGRSFMLKRRDGLLTLADDGVYYGFLTVLDEVLLPSLSLLPSNCCLSEELWTLLKLFPYEIRYRLYGHWKNETYSQHSKLIRVRADTLDRTRYILKRISKENVKPSGRQLGKISHSNAGIVFDYVLTQIQRYDNFIVPVVDALKYLTSLSYDILIYCIIEALANPERERLKHDDTNISLWLQSLANFAGTICRKYQVELTGLLQYVANQLKAGKSYDLLILREVVQKMAGIEISEEITIDQLTAMSGGEMLRQEGGYFAQVRNTKKSSARLKEALQDKNLDVAVCMLMAQQRDSVVYTEDDNRHLKLTGKLYDQCQDTLVQFGSFLLMQLSAEEFSSRLPSIDDLIEKNHVTPDAAFFLSRAQYSYQIYLEYEQLKQDKEGKVMTQKSSRFRQAFDRVIEPIVESIIPIFPHKVWQDLSAKFYTLFWILCDYDLAVPSAAYEKQIHLLKTQILSSDETSESKKKKERERCSNLCDRLSDEQKRQSEHVQRVRSYLEHDKDTWFLSRPSKNETITQFLQLCVFPRCCFTATDAIFCAKLIRLLHDVKTPNFSTLICCDRIFCEITHCVTSCTENEAHRYGRFLCACLDFVMHWHSSSALFDKECAAYPGFITVFRKGVTDVNSTAHQLDYENYRHLVHKWHFRMTKAVVIGLESKNFTQIRNSIIILTKIISHYPKVVQFGQAIQRRIEKLVVDEKDKRPDIYVLALGYSGQLKNTRPTWVPETQFHHKDKPKVEGNAEKTPSDPRTADARTPTDASQVKQDQKRELKRESKSLPQLSGSTTKEKDRSSEKKKATKKVHPDSVRDAAEERLVDLERKLDKAQQRSIKSTDHDDRNNKSNTSPSIQNCDVEERDVKRRKVDNLAMKDPLHGAFADKLTMSPPVDRERERKDRKRDHSKEVNDSDTKKSKSEAVRAPDQEDRELNNRRSNSSEKPVSKPNKSSKKDKDMESKDKVKKLKKDKDRNKEGKLLHILKKTRKSYGDADD